VAQWIDIDARSLEAQSGHDLLKALVVPRPIAWITTLRANGVANLAPFSCYAIVAFRPILVAVGFERALGNMQKKDTLRNIERTSEFVIHTVTEDVLEQMNATARSAPPEESKLLAAGLTPIASVAVAPPRIAECPLAMECRAIEIRQVAEHHDLVIAEGLVIHARADVMRDGEVDLTRLRPVGRMDANSYARLRDVVVLPRPES
jgi:flavin reductase (DIM6/NTAB) family NADH-FMN oxidoreductase RutF